MISSHTRKKAQFGFIVRPCSDQSDMTRLQIALRQSRLTSQNVGGNQALVDLDFALLWLWLVLGVGAQKSSAQHNSEQNRFHLFFLLSSCHFLMRLRMRIVRKKQSSEMRASKMKKALRPYHGKSSTENVQLAVLGSAVIFYLFRWRGRPGVCWCCVCWFFFLLFPKQI